QEFPAYTWIFTANRFGFAYSISSNLPLVIGVYATTIEAMALVVFLSAYFVGNTFHLLSRHTLLISSRTRVLQRKLTVNLVVQISLPITLQIGPMTYYGIVVLTEVSTPMITNIVFCIQLLHAPLHSILLIATTPSYRAAILRSWKGEAITISTRTMQSVAFSTATVSYTLSMAESLIDDVFISFMLNYMHVASGITIALSVVVVYLMVRRTPQSSRQLMKHLMLVQFFITLTDFNFGILMGAIPLFPAPAGLCEGLLCSLGLPAHVGMTVIFFALAYVAASIVYCFHVKHHAVVEL
ncbi:hypothetical protein PENTCL1PPCAC_16608, partial [Pristionchus entomophagus]